MRIRVDRKWFTPISTIGIMSIDGIKTCYTLENPKREDGVKVDGNTAIPAGEYDVIIDYSARFKKMMPHILNVPGFEGIRIHKGNHAKTDTSGCILVGMNRSPDEIYNCFGVFASIFGLIQGAIDRKEDVKIQIVNGFPPC